MKRIQKGNVPKSFDVAVCINLLLVTSQEDISRMPWVQSRPRVKLTIKLVSSLVSLPYPGINAGSTSGLIVFKYTESRKAIARCGYDYYSDRQQGRNYDIEVVKRGLWSHKAYSSSSILEIYLSVAGAACFQGSIIEWCKDHRRHHRYVDTDQDPYSINKGFWHAHMGWLLWKQTSKRNEVDVSDLQSNPIAAWQDRNFSTIAILAGLVFPTIVAGIFWGDWKGGLVYAGILRIFFFQQATFCVNSLAHWLGSQPFDDTHSPRDHIFTALVTFGEGYHNFHHEFPFDYRNGIKWHQYDPSKWMIFTWEKLGLASQLKRFSSIAIKKGEFKQKQKQLEILRTTIDWGTPISQLPQFTPDEFSVAIRNGEKFLVIEGVVYDVQSFIDAHPGGTKAINSCVGKNATRAFNGGIYFHSNAARNLLDDFRIGTLVSDVPENRFKEDEKAVEIS
ncbi:hypothetical protein G7Y89_g13182 [Cudoniella acicularis]|uniref:Cytochrome b5 heme-binding domain-containing protein n=1 Tax=Cudoniella acicularis TaxID=354080 RepID=A0A8H4RA37_9HELO|nr:hypothetical protein G7Y89_g13182 [Cudoniella acicularis]